MKYRNLAEALENARITAIHARHRSRLNDIQMIADERTGYLARIEELSDSIRETSAELLELDDEIADIERQLDSVLGDDGKALGERLRKLEVDVETRKDRISDSESATGEAQDELTVLSKEQTSAKEALEQHQESLTQAEEALVKAGAWDQMFGASGAFWLAGLPILTAVGAILGFPTTNLTAAFGMFAGGVSQTGATTTTDSTESA